MGLVSRRDLELAGIDLDEIPIPPGEPVPDRRLDAVAGEKPGAAVGVGGRVPERSG